MDNTVVYGEPSLSLLIEVVRTKLHGLPNKQVAGQQVLFFSIIVVV